MGKHIGIISYSQMDKRMYYLNLIIFLIYDHVVTPMGSDCLINPEAKQVFTMN